MTTISELFERLDSIGFHQPHVQYYYGPPGSGRDCFTHKIFPEAFEYTFESQSSMEKRWKNYNNQESIIVNVNNEEHLKVFLLDLIVKKIVPFYIIILSSKPPDLLKEKRLNYFLYTKYGHLCELEPFIDQHYESSKDHIQRMMFKIKRDQETQQPFALGCVQLKKFMRVLDIKRLFESWEIKIFDSMESCEDNNSL